MATTYIKNTQSKSSDFKVLDISIQDISNEINSPENSIIKEIPKGWYCIDELIKIINYSRQHITRIIADAKVRSIIIRPNDHRFVKRKRYFCLEEIQKYFTEKPPTGWFTTQDIAKILNRNYTSLKGIITSLRREGKLELRKYRDIYNNKVYFYNLTQIKKYIKPTKVN